MATTSYEDAVRIAQQLTPEERRRLQLELELAAHPGTDAATILRTTQPLDADVLDAMERAIKEACERIPVAEE
ncbi:MAG TPA: hypothetical protein VLA19_25595 [Herpetosiphonaceae bacterium]|nr:hypothetical protein [Herpetosiphonaceae bacterium]